jgi:O-antigen ligase
MLTGFAVLVCATLGFSPAYLNAYSDVKQAVVIGSVSLLGPALLMVLWHGWHGRLPIPAACFAAGWLILLAGFAVGLQRAHNGFEAHKWLMFHSGVALCGWTAVVVALRRGDFLRKLAWLTTLLLLVVGAYGLAQWLHLDPLRTMRAWGMRIELPAGYPGSTFGNANFAVQWTAPAILLALGILLRALSADGRPSRPLKAGVALLAVTVGVAHLGVTQSRGGVLGLAAGLLLAVALLTAAPGFVVFGFRVRAFVLALILLVVAAVGSLVSGTVGRLLRDDMRSAGSTIAYRLDIWQATWRMALAAWPLGVGPGQFDIVLPRFAVESMSRHAGSDYADERVNRAHNEYLDYLSECGVFAAAAWLLVCGSVVAGIWQARGRPDPVYASGVAAVGAIAAQAGVDFPLHNAASALLFATLAGTAVAHGGRRQGPAPLLLAPSPTVVAVATMTGLCLLVLVARDWPARFLVSQHFSRLAVARRAAGRVADAVGMLRQAQAVAPGNREVRALLAGLARQAGETTAARAAAEAWVHLEPWSTSAHNALGAVLAEEGDTTAALKSFCAAYQIAPNNHAARVNAATVLYLEGRTCEAYELYRVAAGSAPRLVEGVIRNYADAAIECGVTSETLDLLGRYVAAHPGDIEMRKKFDAAREAIR